jgi:hypothetical protein
MAFGNGPKIVTSGLILSLDAADRNSYSGTGTVWNDLSGNGNTGTLTNGPTYSSTNGGSILFDGSNDVVTVADNTSVSMTNSLTILTWINATSARNSVGIVHKGNYAAADFDYMLYVTSNSTAIVGYKKNAAGTASAVGGYVVPGGLIGVWTQIGLTIDGTASNLWVNGVSVASTTFSTAGIRDTSNTLNIGYGYQNGFAGYIGNVLTFNRALTPLEIQQNYNALKSRFNLK